jgi:hypothetical protein
MEAIYLSANSFKVMGNRVSEFNAGRRIKANCGLDGTKYSSVYSSSYSAPYTTVVIDESDLTASLTSVWYSVIQTGSIGSLPDHLHSSSEGDGGQLDGSSLGLSFLSFADTPSTYSGTAGQCLRSTSSGIEFAEVQTSSTFLELTDSPSAYDDGKYVRSTSSGIEFAEIQTPASTLLDLTDTPSSYNYGKYLISTTSGFDWTTISGLDGAPGVDGADTTISGSYIKGVQSIKVDYKSESELYINPGIIDVNNVLYENSSRITLSGSSLEISTWYYVYASGDGTNLNFTLSSGISTIDYDRLGYYSTDSRCIGFVLTSSSGTLLNYDYSNSRYNFSGKVLVHYWEQATTQTDYYIDVPFGNLFADLYFFGRKDTTEPIVTIYAGTPGMNNQTIIGTSATHDTNASFYYSVTQEVMCDSDKMIRITADYYPVVSRLYIIGFMMPDYIYNPGSFSQISSGGTSNVQTFLDLTDTPSTYSGTENKYLMSTGSGTEFVDIQTPASTFLDLTDTASAYDNGKYLVSTSSGIEFDTLSYISTDIRADVLVKEWTIVSGSIDETFSWDGDVDDVVVFEVINANIPTGSNIKLQFNNDTGNNYGRGLISQDGSVFEGNTADSQPNIYLTNSNSDPVTVKANMYLKNTGSKRAVLSQQANQRSDDADKFWVLDMASFWNNTSDKVTAIRIWSDNSDFTGTFRLYKKANIDLPVVYGNTLGSAVGIQTIKLEWATTSGINVLPGTVHINNGVYDNYYIVDSYFEKNFSSLSSSVFYYIYVKPPTSGYVINDVEYSTTEPIKNLNKCGRYHPTNTTWRCIGTFRTNPASGIIDFIYNGNTFMGIYSNDVSGWLTPSTTWTTVDVSSSVAFGNTIALQYYIADYVDYSNWGYVRAKGSPSFFYLPFVQTVNDFNTSLIVIPVNEDREFEVCWPNTTSNRMFFLAHGFIIPDDIYTGGGCVSVDNSQFVPYNFGSGTISGTGNIYCNKIDTTIPIFEKGKQTLQVEWASASSINVLPGIVHMKDGMYELDTAITLSGTTANTWNYIYATVSGASSHVLDENSFYILNSTPTKDDTNQGWYYGDDRAVGYVLTDASNNIYMFSMESRDFMFTDTTLYAYNSTWGTGDGTSKTITLIGDSSLNISMMHYIHVDVHNGSTTDGALISVKNADSSTGGGVQVTILENWDAPGHDMTRIWASANSSKQVIFISNSTPTGDWTFRVATLGYKWHKYFYTGA